MTQIVIEKSGIMIEGFYKVILDSVDKWDSQKQEWEDFKKDVDAQIELIQRQKLKNKTN